MQFLSTFDKTQRVKARVTKVKALARARAGPVLAGTVEPVTELKPGLKPPDVEIGLHIRPEVRDVRPIVPVQGSFRSRSFRVGSETAWLSETNLGTRNFLFRS
jgi:hypothetical protein